ncbi:MAG: LysM peptidoglycan-binding domain-containing protein [Elusimicrobia bacterium]|nr:LysM peptidoglycan-binding domain-containing protein [Elusimicrobiota bacterium]
MNQKTYQLLKTKINPLKSGLSYIINIICSLFIFFTRVRAFVAPTVKSSISILLISVICHLSSVICLHADFEDVGTGARPIGMGNAFTALADDVHAVYYNPAGLGKITRAEVTSGYGRMYWGLDDGSNLGGAFLGYVQPVSNVGTLGLGYLNFSLVGHYSENSFLLSYGKSVAENVSFGMNLKMLQKKVGQDVYTAIDPVFDYGERDSKTGYSLDFGSLFNVTQKLSFAFSMTDINQPDMIFHPTPLMEQNRVPYGIKTGVAYQEDTLNVAVDAAFKENDVKVYTGAEKWFSNYTFALRGGLGIGTREYKNMAVGASYSVSLFNFDYAFIYPLSGIQETYGSHRFSLTLMFGATKEEIKKRAAVESLEKRVESAMISLEKSRQEAEDARLEAEKAKQEAEKARQEAEKLREDAEKLEAAKISAEKVAAAKKVHEDAVRREKERQYNYWYLKGEQNIEYGYLDKALDAFNKALSYKSGDSKAINEIEYVKKQLKKQAEPEHKAIPKYYTVKEGDTLPLVADKIYGDSSRWPEIYEINKDKIREGKIKPGQVLIIHSNGYMNGYKK